MLDLPYRTTKHSMLVAAAVAITVFVNNCAAQAQNVNTNIPVLVVAEDQDTGSVNHCHGVHKRVVGELRGSMQRDGFRMLDEESIRATLGWAETCTPQFGDGDRRSKQAAIEDIKRMMSSKRADVPVRAWVLYRIHAQKIPFDSGYDARVRINGEIYDAASNAFLDNFQAERMRFPLPDNCNRVCIYEIVGDNASNIAANMGAVLSRKLQRYAPGQSAGSDPIGGSLCTELPTPLNITMRHFDNMTASSITNVMAKEFPCYKSHQLLNSGSAVRAYAYTTQATTFKIEEWLIILLRDMGFNDRDFAIEINGINITLTNLVPDTGRPRSEDEKGRFN
jgi:hypothetical protein